MLVSKIFQQFTTLAEFKPRETLNMNLPRPFTVTITPAGQSINSESTASVKAQYKILRIYLKGSSTEVPDMVNVPRQAISPHVGIDMQTLANPAGPGALECELRIALHARLDGITIFKVEVSVAGVFELDISNMEDAQRFVRKIAPSVLFPFARRDLASLTVAAGFQPVLLDHVDFDAMLEQVIRSHRLTRKSMTMQLDTIAAKPPTSPILPASATLAQVTQEVHPLITAASEWPKTQLPHAPTIQQDSLARLRRTSISAVVSGLPAQPVALQTGTIVPLATRFTPNRRAMTQMFLALLGITTLVGGTAAWWTGRKPAVVLESVPSVTKVVTHELAAGPVSPVSTPTFVTPQPISVPVEIQRVMEVSRTRLAEQPADWFTLDLGSALVTAPLATLFPSLPIPGRPMFLLAGKDDSMRLLYGVFPSKEAAKKIQNQLQQSGLMKEHQTVMVVPIGSFL